MRFERWGGREAERGEKRDKRRRYREKRIENRIKRARRERLQLLIFFSTNIISINESLAIVKFNFRIVDIFFVIVITQIFKISTLRSSKKCYNIFISISLFIFSSSLYCLILFIIHYSFLFWLPMNLS